MPFELSGEFAPNIAGLNKSRLILLHLILKPFLIIFDMFSKPLQILLQLLNHNLKLNLLPLLLLPLPLYQPLPMPPLLFLLPKLIFYRLSIISLFISLLLALFSLGTPLFL